MYCGGFPRRLQSKRAELGYHENRIMMLRRLINWNTSLRYGSMGMSP